MDETTVVTVQEMCEQMRERMERLYVESCANPYLTNIGSTIITGTEIARRNQASIGDVIAQEREAATAAERARVLAVLEKFKPMEQVYSRRDVIGP